jgi:hypothetical protein
MVSYMVSYCFKVSVKWTHRFGQDRMGAQDRALLFNGLRISMLFRGNLTEEFREKSSLAPSIAGPRQPAHPDLSKSKLTRASPILNCAYAMLTRQEKDQEN